MANMSRINLSIIYVVALLLAPGCSNDRAEVESVYRQYLVASKNNDDAAVEKLMTKRLYELYLESKKSSNAKQGENVSFEVDSISGDSAYANVEFKGGEKTFFQRVVFKRIDGAWRLAGRQD